MMELDLLRLISPVDGSQLPSIDSMIIEMTSDQKLEVVIYNTIGELRRRLSYAGFRKSRQAVIANKEIINFLRDCSLINIKLITSSDFPKDTAIILTASADKRLLIHPPYKKDHSIMSWDEFFLRRLRGEQLKILVVAPWAQAKIMGIKL